jgi:hypothetical protein
VGLWRCALVLLLDKGRMQLRASGGAATFADTPRTRCVRLSGYMWFVTWEGHPLCNAQRTSAGLSWAAAAAPQAPLVLLAVCKQAQQLGPLWLSSETGGTGRQESPQEGLQLLHKGAAAALQHCDVVTYHTQLSMCTSLDGKDGN